MRNVFFAVVVLIAVLYIVSSVASGVDVKSKMGPALTKEMEKNSDEKIRVIVHVDKEKYKRRFDSLSTSVKAEKEFEIIPAVVVEVPANQLGSLAKENYVKSIEPVLEVRALLQSSVPLIKANEVWSQQVLQQSITGRNVGICILDTGVNYTHPDLGGCFGSGCRVASGYDFVNDDSNPMDDEGHGTHVAGIVAANGNITGVAPNASIIAIKVLDSNGIGTTEDVISAIEWCVSNRTIYNISVISMSLGTTDLFSSYCDDEEGLTGIRDSVNSAVAKNITVVAAAGNDASTTSMSAPACIQNVTAVGATTKTDSIASFSNRNNITDLLAPGASINSTELSGYSFKSGTSMATPHVSGAFALLYQKYRLTFGKDPTPSHLQQILNETGVRINDTSGNKLNFSRIDVHAASLKIGESVPPLWQNQSSNSTLFNATDAVLLSAFWTDDVLLSSSYLLTNETGIWKNKTTLQLSGSSSWSNFTWSNSALANGTVVAWHISAYDTSGNQNTTDNLTFTVVDNINPQFFNVSNSSDNNYSPKKIYHFNITWIDAGIDKVIFEWNSSENVTIDSIGNSIYSTNKTDLAVGNYFYRWFANDTAGNNNFTDILAYSVNRVNTNVTLLLNGLEGNATFYKNQNFNITASLNSTNLPIEVSANFTNGTHAVIASGFNMTFNLINASDLDLGKYNITAFYNGNNSNYSASSQTYFLTIRHIYQNDSINITNSTPTIVNTTTNATLTIVTNDSTIGSISVSVGVDNPTGQQISDFGVNKFIAIEANISNLTYVIINISYSDTNISDSIDKASLRIYYWNLTHWLRQDINGGVNTDEQYVFANMTHFSNFTIGGLLDDGQLCTTASQCSGGFCNSGVCASSPPTTTTTLPATTTTVQSSGGGAVATTTTSSTTTSTTSTTTTTVTTTTTTTSTTIVTTTTQLPIGARAIAVGTTNTFLLVMTTVLLIFVVYIVRKML